MTPDSDWAILSPVQHGAVETPILPYCIFSVSRRPTMPVLSQILSSDSVRLPGNCKVSLRSERVNEKRKRLTFTIWDKYCDGRSIQLYGCSIPVSRPGTVLCVVRTVPITHLVRVIAPSRHGLTQSLHLSTSAASLQAAGRNSRLSARPMLLQVTPYVLSYHIASHRISDIFITNSTMPKLSPTTALVLSSKTLPILQYWCCISCACIARTTTVNIFESDCNAVMPCLAAGQSRRGAPPGQCLTAGPCPALPQVSISVPD